MVTDTSLVLNQALDRGETVLFEGGQATMLDVDHGTYPFVTSSSATAGGASTGSGVGPTRIDSVIGIVKAYTTRVGEGPMPTEPVRRDGRLPRGGGSRVRHHHRSSPPLWLVRRGHRPLRGAHQRPHRPGADQGSTSSPGSTRSPCASRTTSTASATRSLPQDQAAFAAATPVYEYLPGWTEDISGARDFSDLPQTAQDYVMALEKISNCRISAIGVGPGREEIIVNHDLLHVRGA
ncbi:hypothetical protein GCM10025876_16480 [Demequina litorisediminis]|uniref:Adenylosuccinate synthetase n=1 Tax=Demequina litorisediminis TaxID=1849022 RepID=A0ABQ6IFC4_9MICO|nr:hypothetical protein GCM10025876_16480 [Demequina litorisediminis]